MIYLMEQVKDNFLIINEKWIRISEINALISETMVIGGE